MTRQTHQEFRGYLQHQVEIQNVKDHVSTAYARKHQPGTFVRSSDVTACKSYVYTAMVQSYESLSSPFQTAQQNTIEPF